MNAHEVEMGWDDDPFMPDNIEAAYEQQDATEQHDGRSCRCGDGAASAPNLTHIDIIARHIITASWECQQHGVKEFACACGIEFTREDHAAHVVSKLADAGYSIVQVCRYCSNPIEHTLGRWRHAGNGFGMLTCGSKYRDAGGSYRFAAPAAAEGEKP